MRDQEGEIDFRPGSVYIAQRGKGLSMAMELSNIELMVSLQVFTYIHDQRVVHRQFTPVT